MGAMQRARANSRVARRRQRSAQQAVDGLPTSPPLNDLSGDGLFFVDPGGGKMGGVET